MEVYAFYTCMYLKNGTETNNQWYSLSIPIESHNNMYCLP